MKAAAGFNPAPLPAWARTRRSHLKQSLIGLEASVLGASAMSAWSVGRAG